MWGFFINYRWAHTCRHTHIHRQPFTQMRTLFLQTEISIVPWPLVKSHAGSSLCPPSSLVHDALRLSGFGKIEEGLKSFKEKQVGLEHRLLNPHLHVLPQCLDLFAFPWLRGMWKPKKQPTPLEKVPGRAWRTLDRRLRSAAFFGCLLFIHSSFHSTKFTKHLLYPKRNALPAGNPKASKSSLPLRSSQGQLQKQDQAVWYSEHIQEWSAALIGQSRWAKPMGMKRSEAGAHPKSPSCHTDEFRFHPVCNGNH